MRIHRKFQKFAYLIIPCYWTPALIIGLNEPRIPLAETTHQAIAVRHPTSIHVSQAFFEKLFALQLFHTLMKHFKFLRKQKIFCLAIDGINSIEIQKQTKKFIMFTNNITIINLLILQPFTYFKLTQNIAQIFFTKPLFWSFLLNHSQLKAKISQVHTGVYVQ